MKKFIGAALLLSTITMGSAHAGNSIRVSNGNNDGPGSLRAALESGASLIRLSRSIDTIYVTEPLVSESPTRLNIMGSGQTIDGSGIIGNGNILSVTDGADLKISNLRIIGNAAGINNDPSKPIGGKGIFLNVPNDKQGVVRVRLENVSVSRVGNHGIHVSDCTLGDECGAGTGGDGDGSAASIYVRLNRVLVNNVGFGKADADGVRVDDRGDGSIYFLATDSTFINVGADGIELDEGNNGHVVADVRNSLFDSNGEYCNLATFVAAGPCDDDGDPDVDDGFDIDEAGDGSLYARIRDTGVSNNFDEGLDFDEEGAGGIEAQIVNVYASNNADEGIKMSEENDGDLRAYLRSSTTADNNGRKEGIELEEADHGDADVVVVAVNMIGSDNEQLKVEQSDDGEGSIIVRRSTVILDLDGVVEN